MTRDPTPSATELETGAPHATPAATPGPRQAGDHPRESARSRARDFFDRPAPEDYLAEWAQRLAAPPDQPDPDLISVVIFRLADEWLALTTSSLVEVTDPHPVHAIPHRSNDVLRGLVNIRGQLRLCVSLHGLLGVGAPSHSESHAAADTPSSGTRMVIVQDRRDQWAFLVDELVGVHHVTARSLREVPSTFPRDDCHSRAVFPWKEHTVGLLNEERVFAALRNLSP